MKIWIITQYFYPENFNINQVAVDLAGRGHQVTVLSGMPNYPSGEFSPGFGGWRVRRDDHNGIAVIRVPVLARGRGTPARLVLNYLSYAIIASIVAPFVLRGRPDAIFVYQPSPLTVAFPAIVLSWIKRSPVVLWVQDLWPESLAAGNLTPSPSLVRIVRRIAGFIYRRCALVLVQSPAYVAPIQALAPQAAIRYFPNSADRQYHPIDAPAGAAELFGLPDGFRVIYAGNVGIAQDFDTIVAAAERLRDRTDIQWVIVGEGRRKGWLRNEIAKRKLGGTFHLIDQQLTDLMPSYFALAHALLVTLSKSPVAAITIPAKVQAYLACGRPIIGAIEGEAAKIVAQSGAGLTCAPGRPAELADTVIALRNKTPAEREQMGKAGRRYFEAEFEQTVLMEKLIGWLTELTK